MTSYNSCITKIKQIVGRRGIVKRGNSKCLVQHGRSKTIHPRHPLTLINLFLDFNRQHSLRNIHLNLFSIEIVIYFFIRYCIT
jgi:hypothetical protein